MKSRCLSLFSGVFFAFLMAPASLLSQSTAAAADSSLQIPFKDLQVTNIQAVGDKKTGVVIVSMDFVNMRKDNFVQAMLSFSGPAYFLITPDKGSGYSIHTYFDPKSKENPHLKYKRVQSIKFGDKEMGIATSINQEIDTGQSKRLTVALAGVDKNAKEISKFVVWCLYDVRYDRVGEAYYKISNVPISWKEEKKVPLPRKKG